MTELLDGWFAHVDSATAPQRLAAWRLQRIGSRFRFLRDTVHSEIPDEARRSGFAAAAEILDHTTLRELRPVLEYPGFERWLDRCLGLVSRRRNGKLPHATTLPQLSVLTTFTLAFADPGVPLRSRVDADGLVQLRGTGRMLRFPTAAAGTWVSACRGETGEVTAEPGAGVRVVELPRTSAGWEVNPVDRLLTSRARRVSGLPEPGADGDAGDAAERAWELIGQVLPERQAGLRAFPWVVVPVAAAEPATGAHLGLWELPAGMTTPELAAELVVAADEARIALAVEQALTTSPAGTPRWSRVAAPVRRAVRGASGGAFWWSCAPALTGADRALARRKAEACRWVWSAAVAELRDVPGLPAEVRNLLAPLYTAPAGHGQRSVRIPDVDARRIARFESAWRDAGGATRDRAGSRAILPATGLGPAGRLAGVGDGLRVNLPYEGVDRADGSLDRLGLASVRDPGLVARTRAMIGEGPASGDPLVHAIRGHLAYVSGQPDQAARYYATAARMVPESLDFWHDLAFALLHIGKRESRVFRFAPDLLVHAVSGVRIDPAVAHRVAGEPDNGLVAADIDDLTCLLLMIRAVNRAADLELI